MTLSHLYKFIFLKTAKTAGTSIEIALSKFCGPDDIITPISPKDEEFRRGLGYRTSQNCFSPYREYDLRALAALLLKGQRKLKFKNHMLARDVKRIVGDDIWNSYYKFCFERNPWDRVVSLYFWYRHAESKQLTLFEFLHSDVPLTLRQKGFELYTIDGQVVVDRICRFENMLEELEEVRLRLGIPERLDLPRAKSGFRDDAGNYRDLLGEKERARITELFYREIELFGYEF